MSITTDRNDPDLKEQGNDGMQKTYLVLSDEEKAKGFIRPVRQTYIHVGRIGVVCGGGQYTDDAGRTWVCAMSPHAGKHKGFGLLENMQGCGAQTTMGISIAETYARDPKFYGATYCVGCRTHRPVSEFVWDGTDERVGS